MNASRKGLVGRGQQDQKLSIRVLIIFLLHAIQRRLLIDRVNHGPGEGEECDRSAFKIKHIEFANGPSIHVNETRDHDLGLNLDQLIVPSVDDAKHERRDVLVRSDYSYVAQDDLRSWPSEACENQAGDQ